jgi:hypothetical protein
VGVGVGEGVGAGVGARVGVSVGTGVGEGVGWLVGAAVGYPVGLDVARQLVSVRGSLMYPFLHSHSYCSGPSVLTQLVVTVSQSCVSPSQGCSVGEGVGAVVG